MPFATDLVDRLDHLMIEADDPSWLFALFTEQLGLPAAWPLEERDSVVSAGVQAGHVTLALVRFCGLRFGQPLSRPVTPPGTARLTGLALAPARPLPDVLQALQWRGLSTGFVDEVAGWMVAVLPGLLSPPAVVFFVGEGAARPEAGGGVLGLRGVAEVAVASPSPEGWARLLMPTQPVAGDRYPLGGGLALAVRPAEVGEIEGLTLRVASLAQARTALEGLGLLGAAGPEYLELLPERLGGLRLRLVGPA